MPEQALTPDFLAILRTLAEHKVEFIVIGGVCAVLHGAPIATFDLDVVHARTAKNINNLLNALHALDAVYREHRQTRLQPDKASLASPGHHLLSTQVGPLDLLGTVSQGRDYDSLLAHSIKLPIGTALEVQLLDMETLIALKEEMGRDKDMAVLSILRHTLKEKSKPS